MDNTLAAHLKNDTVAPSYLLIDRDLFKLREIAKSFSENYSSADIFRLDGSPSIKVAETQDFIARAHLAAVGNRKLFIICDAATMTIAAQNKTLKTIEDAPANTTFMLLASSDTPILNTIKSRCVIIYPDPLPQSHDEAHPIYLAAKKLLAATTLDEALPLLPTLTKRENFTTTIAALDYYSNTLTIPRRNAILKSLAIINRNTAAGCNPTNAFDTLLMELIIWNKII